MEINELVQKAHENAKAKGFWEDWELSQIGMHVAVIEGNYEYTKRAVMLKNNAIGNRLMLITGEVSEAHEALRKSDNENFAEELADIVIRVFDLAGGLSIDLEAEILKKMEKNKERPYKHGKVF